MNIRIIFVLPLLSFSLGKAQSPQTEPPQPKLTIASGLGIWQGFNFHINALYFVHKRVSVGGAFATGKNEAFKKENSWYDYNTFTYYSTSHIPKETLIALRTEFIPLIKQRFCIYIAGTCGLGILKYNDPSLNRVAFVPGISGGLRKYFRPHIGWYIEGGTGRGGGMGYFSTGLAYSL